MIDDIITDVLKAEGWDKYTDHPADRGGPTKWGITLKAWGDYLGQPVSAFNVRAITEGQARDFYLRKYVVEPKFDKLPEGIMALVVDCGVNHGPRRATKWLQRALGVKQDGILGPVSLAAARDQSWTETYVEICAYRAELYGRLVTSDPSQAVFAAGWNNRLAKWLLRLARHLLTPVANAD